MRGYVPTTAYAPALNRNRKTLLGARHHFGGPGLRALPGRVHWRCRGGCVNRLSGTDLVGRLCQTPRRFTERSRGDASDVDGQAGGQGVGANESNALQFYFRLTALCDPLACRCESRHGHANGSTDHLSWMSGQRCFFHLWHNHPTNCTERWRETSS